MADLWKQTDMTESKCSVTENSEPCGLPVDARGMCPKHYMRWRRHGSALGGRAAPGDYSWIEAGVQFNDWTATGTPFLKRRDPAARGVTYVPVVCVCGLAAELQASGLASGRSKSCRSCSAKQRMAERTKSLACPRCTATFSSPSPRSTVCPTCRPDYQRELNRSYMDDKGPEYAAASRHKARGRRYGLTPDEFDARLAAQRFKCAVCDCGADEGRRRLNLDHDHGCCNHALTPGRPACGMCARGFLCDGCNLGGGITDSVELLLRKVAYLRRWTDHRATVELAAA